MEERKPRRPSGVQVYSSTRGLWIRPYSETRKGATRTARERVRERERRRKGCTFACRAAVWLAPTTHAFCSSVPQPAALGFSVESENGFLPFSPAVPMATTRATNFSSTFTSSFPSLQVLSYYLKFQPFSLRIVSFSPSACRVPPFEQHVISTCNIDFRVFITLFKLPVSLNARLNVFFIAEQIFHVTSNNRA